MASKWWISLSQRQRVLSDKSVLKLYGITYYNSFIQNKAVYREFSLYSVDQQSPLNARSNIIFSIYYILEFILAKWH